jgi:hypothetical protein
MKARCYETANIRYSNYGGRGITVCDRWRYSFENFIADMGEKPTPKHSIDRIDNNGNYEPGNCRWATPSEQVLNRNVWKYEFNGKMLNPCQIDIELGLKIGTVSGRKNKNKWTIEEIASHNKNISGHAKDMTGVRFGSLTAIQPMPKKHRYVWWECKCDCGEVVSVRSDILRTGKRVFCSAKRHAKLQIHGQ